MANPPQPTASVDRPPAPKRAWNIAFRTMHIGSSSVILGGHVLGVERDRILVWLYLTLLTGVCLSLIEAYPSWVWFWQGRGVCVLGKLVLLCLIPWLWEYRIAILAMVLVVASVGAHMPARYRYYSLLHRRVVHH